MQNVVLIGFMGTGKTSTGKVLAEKLGCTFHDLDEAIEEAFGMTIPSMFAEKGEAYFRDCEKQMVKKAAVLDKTVISTGGGTVKDPENVRLLREKGIIIALYANIDVIMQRTASKGERPVLDKEDRGDRRNAVAKLMKERRDLYRQADFSVDTSDLSPLEVAESILGFLKLRGAFDA